VRRSRGGGNGWEPGRRNHSGVAGEQIGRGEARRRGKLGERYRSCWKIGVLGGFCGFCCVSGGGMFIVDVLWACVCPGIRLERKGRGGLICHSCITVVPWVVGVVLVCFPFAVFVFVCGWIEIFFSSLCDEVIWLCGRQLDLILLEGKVNC